MDPDQELSKKVADYQQVAKENPQVDIGMLMMNALATEKQNTVSIKAKRWAYSVSLGAPPLGLLFALKYYSFSEESDARQVAWTCIILTVFSVLVYWIGGKILLSGSGASVQQIQQIKPSDIKQIYQ